MRTCPRIGRWDVSTYRRPSWCGSECPTPTSVPAERAGMASAHDAPGVSSAGSAQRGVRAARPARFAERPLRPHAGRHLCRAARRDRAAGLRRLRQATKLTPSPSYALSVPGSSGRRREGCRRRRWARRAGSLLDLGRRRVRCHAFEARPTLGGLVQTLPARAGDLAPPPDNGQHVALGCCTEYLRFLGRPTSRRGSPPAADPAGHRRATPGRLSEPARLRSSATAISRSVTASAWRGSRAARPAGACRTRRRDVRVAPTAAWLDSGRDRPILGRVHPPGAQPAV